MRRRGAARINAGRALAGLQAGKLVRPQLNLRHYLHAHIVGYGNRLIGAVVVEQYLLTYGYDLVGVLKGQIFRYEPQGAELCIGRLRCGPCTCVPLGLVLYLFVLLQGFGYIEAHGLAEVFVPRHLCRPALHTPLIFELAILAKAYIRCVDGLTAAVLYYLYGLDERIGICGGVVIGTVVRIPKELHIIAVFAVCQYYSVAVEYPAAGALYIY